VTELRGYTTAEIARVCHEANRALQHVIDEPAPSPSWDDAPEWQRESAVEGVRAAFDGATPEQLHDAWSEHKRREGWVYGPEKDAERLTHPCLVSYDELPSEQRSKDALFAAIVHALTPELVSEGE
jgi:hypothetical protein